MFGAISSPSCVTSIAEEASLKAIIIFTFGSTFQNNSFKKNETVCWKIVRQRWSRWIEPVWIEKSCKSCSLRWFPKTKKACGYFLWLRTPTANWYALYIRNMSSAAIPSWLEICGASRDFESWISFTWILTKISQLMVFECLWMCFFKHLRTHDHEEGHKVQKAQRCETSKFTKTCREITSY